MEPHADLLGAAQSLLQSCGYKVELMFVRGHQDNGQPTVLTRDAWLNVEADHLVKQKNTQPHIGPRYYKLPGNPWSCYIGNKHVVKQFTATLRDYIHGKEALDYWTKRKQMNKERLQEIDWISLGKAMKEVPISKWHWVSKQMSGHFSHGKNTVRWKQHSFAACPQCGCTPEDKNHILTCQQEEATEKWEVALTNLEDWLKQEQSDPQLIIALLNGLCLWRKGESVPDDTSATAQQANIGWDAAMDGWLGTEWQATEAAYWAQWR